jgi:hypothetical protein
MPVEPEEKVPAIFRDSSQPKYPSLNTFAIKISPPKND